MARRSWKVGRLLVFRWEVVAKSLKRCCHSTSQAEWPIVDTVAPPSPHVLLFYPHPYLSPLVLHASHYLLSTRLHSRFLLLLSGTTPCSGSLNCMIYLSDQFSRLLLVGSDVSYIAIAHHAAHPTTIITQHSQPIRP